MHIFDLLLCMTCWAGNFNHFVYMPLGGRELMVESFQSRTLTLFNQLK